MARSPAPTSTPLADLTSHIAALIATDKLLLAQQLQLERAKVFAVEPAPPGATSVAALAQGYLNGFAALSPDAGQSAGEILWTTQAKRIAIKSAISNLERQRLVLQAASDRAAAAAAEPEWLAKVRRWFDIVRQLEQLERDMTAMLDAPGGVYHPLCEHFRRPPLGIRWQNSPDSSARHAATKAGVIGKE